jgi:hypothetical protein
MKTMERTYTDLTSLDAYPSTAVYPTQVWTSQLSSSLADSHARLFGFRPSFPMNMFEKVAIGKSNFLYKKITVFCNLLRSQWRPSMLFLALQRKHPDLYNMKLLNVFH